MGVRKHKVGREVGVCKHWTDYWTYIHITNLVDSKVARK